MCRVIECSLLTGISKVIVQVPRKMLDQPPPPKDNLSAVPVVESSCAPDIQSCRGCCNDYAAGYPKLLTTCRLSQSVFSLFTLVSFCAPIIFRGKMSSASGICTGRHRCFGYFDITSVVSQLCSLRFVLSVCVRTHVHVCAHACCFPPLKVLLLPVFIAMVLRAQGYWVVLVSACGTW